jgi:hypothetical protein
MYPEYVLIRAARFLGVAPWDLEMHESKWRDWGLICEKADALVDAALAKRK